MAELGEVAGEARLETVSEIATQLRGLQAELLVAREQASEAERRARQADGSRIEAERRAREAEEATLAATRQAEEELRTVA